MKGNGIRIKGMAKDLKSLLMEISMKENIQMVKLMEREYFTGIMGKFMMVNGLKVLKRDMECGKVLREILI